MGLFKTEFLVLMLNCFVFSDSGTSDVTLNQVRMKRIADEWTDEEEPCSLTDSCIVDNVTARSITVQWPCCAGKSFDVISNTVGFKRGYTTCKCGNEPEFRHSYFEREREKTLRTSDCYATFTDYCPYGDYEIVIKTQEESCSIQQSTLPEVPEWSQTKALAEDKILVSWTDGYCTQNKKPIYRISWMDPDLVETVEEQTETEMNISRLLPNTKYTIKLQACDNHKHWNDRKFCSRNITTEITTKSGTPSQPLNVSAAAVNATTILLTWNTPEDPRGSIDGYEVLCRKGKRIVHRVFVEGYQSSYLVNKLHSWTRYSCTMQAFNTDPESAQKLLSKKSFATTITKPENPSSPNNLTVEEITSHELLLSWKRPSAPRGPIDGYCVKIYNSNEEREEIVSPTSLQHRFKNLSPGTSYKMTMFAFNYDIIGEIPNENSALNGTETDPISNTTKPTAPTAPRDVRIAKASVDEMLLKWKRPSQPGGSIDGYVIKVLTDELNIVVNGTTLSRRLTDLSPNTNYTIAIFAFNYDHNYNDDYDNHKRLDGEEVIVKYSTKAEELAYAKVLNELKLEIFGIKSLLNETFRTYLTNRTLRERVTGPCLYPPCPIS